MIALFTPQTLTAIRTMAANGTRHGGSMADGSPNAKLRRERAITEFASDLNGYDAEGAR